MKEERPEREKLVWITGNGRYISHSFEELGTDLDILMGANRQGKEYREILLSAIQDVHSLPECYSQIEVATILEKVGEIMCESYNKAVEELMDVIKELGLENDTLMRQNYELTSERYALSRELEKWTSHQKGKKPQENVWKKLEKYEEDILTMRGLGASRCAIAREYGVSETTIRRFLADRGVK